MTGYNSSDFIRRYTLSEFSMKQNLDDKWDQICLKAIEENDKIALIGINGTGKSTFLKILAVNFVAYTFKFGISLLYSPEICIFIYFY